MPAQSDRRVIHITIPYQAFSTDVFPSSQVPVLSLPTLGSRHLLAHWVPILSSLYHLLFSLAFLWSFVQPNIDPAIQ